MMAETIQTIKQKVVVVVGGGGGGGRWGWISFMIDYHFGVKEICYTSPI